MGFFPALDAGSQTGVVQTALALAEFNRMMSPFPGWTSLPHKKITLAGREAMHAATCVLHKQVVNVSTSYQRIASSEIARILEMATSKAAPA